MFIRRLELSGHAHGNVATKNVDVLIAIQVLLHGWSLAVSSVYMDIEHEPNVALQAHCALRPARFVWRLSQISYLLRPNPESDDFLSS